MAKRKEKITEEIKSTTTKIKFLLSPTGKYHLAYSIGDVAEFDVNKAAELVESQFAEYVK